MKDLFDTAMWREAVVTAAGSVGATIAEYGAKLAVALALVGVGWGVARIVQTVSRRAAARLGMDKLVKRLGVSESFDRVGLAQPPSELLGRLMFWVILLIFLLLAVDALGLRAASATIDRLLQYVPRIAGATIIVFAGILLGRLARNVIASGGALGGAENVSRVAAFANVATVATALILAAGQLGVETGILVSVTTALVATFGLSVGLAFALGARDVVTHLLAGHFLRQRFQTGQSIELDGTAGVVRQVGVIDTVVDCDDEAVSIPNRVLIEKTVKHRKTSAQESS